MYTHCRDLHQKSSEFINKSVTLGGWIRTLRDNKNFAFIELYDGSFFKTVQVVIDQDLKAEEGTPSSLTFEEAVKLGVGACVTISGTVVESPGAKQSMEVKADTLILEGACPSDYPLQKKRHTLEFLRTIAHLRPRTNTLAAVFRVRSLANRAIHEFFWARNFVYVHTPILTGSDCEGAGEMFKVTTLPVGEADHSKDFFGKPAYLTVSGQLAVEPFTMGFRDVYTFGPTFRSEQSNTTTHVAEFWMLEPEMAFADLDNYLETAEALLKHVIKYVLENAPEEMDFFNQFVDKDLINRLEKILKADFNRLTYTKAIELLQKELAEGKVKFEFPIEWGVDLQTEHERYLSEKIFQGPVYLTDYPRDLKAFYMRLNDDKKTVAAADLLVPGVGELIGGSQREERLEMLKENMLHFGLSPEDYDWYLDLRRYGGVKHAGFGLGFERLLMYLTGMKNIRDVIPYPRAAGQMAF